ncbi:MAG TPA: periplasmic heavy metal sensor [Thermoanaerobaculia bacterium]
MKRTVVFAALLIFATVALAQRGPHPGPPQQGQGGPAGAPIPGLGPDTHAVSDYLGLSAEQRAAWQTIQSELRSSVQALHEQQRTLGEQLRTALEGSDASAIGALMLQLKGIRTQIDAAREAAEARFTATLTTEQQTKFAALMAAADYLRERGPGGRH